MFRKCTCLPDTLTRVSPDIPELSEPEVIRHYTALSRLSKTYEIKNTRTPRKHEAGFSASKQKKKYDVSALDIAKYLIGKTGI